jgi:hypothetical protein
VRAEQSRGNDDKRACQDERDDHITRPDEKDGKNRQSAKHHVFAVFGIRLRQFMDNVATTQIQEQHHDAHKEGGRFQGFHMCVKHYLMIAKELGRIANSLTVIALIDFLRLLWKS